jgi:hypothetical protein
MAAGLEIDIYSRTSSAGTGFLERPHFCMLQIVIAMITSADDHTVLQDNRTHERVWAHQRSALRGELKCEL